MYVSLCVCVLMSAEAPLELELQVSAGHPACYVDAIIQTLVFMISQQALLAAKPSLQIQNVCECVSLCAHMQVCMHSAHMYMQARCQHQMSSSIIFQLTFFSNSLFMNLKFADSTKLAGR